MRTKLLTTVALLIAGRQAVATTISLDFSTLPSAQGWQFVGNAISEASAFSVDGTTLRQNTIGSGFSGWAYYQMPNLLDPTKGYSIQVRARVISEEFDSLGAFTFAAYKPDWYSSAYLGKSSIGWVESGPNRIFVFDNSSFHDYRLEVAPSGSQTLFIDNTVIATGTVDTTPSVLPNLIWFGDGGSGVNGQVEITKYIFEQPVQAAVPLPSTLLLLLSGLGGLLYRTKQ